MNSTGGVSKGRLPIKPYDPSDLESECFHNLCETKCSEASLHQTFHPTLWDLSHEVIPLTCDRFVEYYIGGTLVAAAKETNSVKLKFTPCELKKCKSGYVYHQTAGRLLNPLAEFNRAAIINTYASTGCSTYDVALNIACTLDDLLALHPDLKWLLTGDFNLQGSLDASLENFEYTQGGELRLYSYSMFTDYYGGTVYHNSLPGGNIGLDFAISNMPLDWNPTNNCRRLKQREYSKRTHSEYAVAARIERMRNAGVPPK